MMPEVLQNRLQNRRRRLLFAGFRDVSSLYVVDSLPEPSDRGKSCETVLWTMSSLRKLVDIGVNLTDPVFRGIYNSSQKHASDLSLVLKRALEVGVSRMIITGTSLSDSVDAAGMAEECNQTQCDVGQKFYSTVGCHPTRCMEFQENPQDYITGLRSLLTNKTVVALGEIGLDYDRLQFCPKEVQQQYFEKQLTINTDIKLPLFLHCRAAADDLKEILSRNRDKFTTGVVHSFDGSLEEAQAFIDMGLFIGINGCSLKTENNLKVVKELPLEKILVETDAPWCDVRPTHSGHRFIKSKFEKKKKEKFIEGFQVNGRNEPCNIVQVLEIIAGVKEVPVDDAATVVTKNTETVFHF